MLPTAGSGGIGELGAFTTELPAIRALVFVNAEFGLRPSPFAVDGIRADQMLDWTASTVGNKFGERVAVTRYR